MDAIHCVWQQERIPARRQCAAASSAFRIARHLPRVVRSQPHQPARRAHLCLAIPRRAFPVELQVAVLAPGTHRDLKLLLRHEFRPAGGLSDVWGSGRTLRCLRNPFIMHDLEAWKTSPAPIPFTIRAWTRPHSARLSEPAADGGQTGARPPTDAAQRVGASANPPVRHVSALYVRVGIPPPLLLSSDTSFARAALGFFPLPHTEAIAIRFHDGTASPPRRAAACSSRFRRDDSRSGRVARSRH